MSRHGAAEDGLNRLKNVYRPRYLYGDGLQEPQKTRPGQNILSAIKNCFEDPNSQAYFKKPGNIIRMDSLLSLESGSTMLDSESGEEEDTEQTTPGDEGAVLLEKAATPTGAVRNLAKSLDRTYILEQSAVQNPASPTITLPTKKRLSFKNFTEPEANNKRMRMSEKDLICSTDEKESEIQHHVMAVEKKNFASPHKKRTTLTGFPEKRPSKVVPYPQNSLFQQQDEIEHDNEDEFMIDEVDSFVVNSWISNPKKAKSDLKGSMSAHSKKSQQVNEEAKNIQRDICDRARVVNKELSSEKFSSYGHNTNMSPKNKGGTGKKNLGQRLCENDLDYLSSEVQNLQQTLSNSQIVINTQSASEAALARIRGTSVYIARELQSPNLKQKHQPESSEEVQLPKTKVTSTSKSVYIQEIDMGGPFQKQKKQPDPQNMELIQSLKDAADMEEGKRYANADNPKEDQAEACLPEKSGSLGKSNVRTGLSTGKKSLTKKTMQSSAFKQNAHKPEVLENTGETEGFATLGNSKILEKPNHLLEIRNPRSPVYSMFLQAATQGHATRYSVVQEAPIFNIPHQGEEDDNDFVFDEAALLDCEPLISIPRRGKPLPSKKIIWSERDTGSRVCTDSMQNDTEKDQNNVGANEQNQQATPKEKSTRKNPALSDKNFTLNKEKPLDKVDNSIKLSTQKGKKSKSACVDGPSELDEHDNNALSDEPHLKKTSSKKQILSKTNKGKPVKKAQKKKQTRSKGKPTPLNRNKNNGGQEAINTGTGFSDEACTPDGIQKQSKSARISIYSKVVSPARRNIFSSDENENPHVTNLQIASSPYKRVKKKDIDNFEFPETLSSQDLKQAHTPNQRLQASAAEKVTSAICDQLETGRTQRISRPPSQWWIVSPSHTNKTVLVEPELPSKSLQKENKNKSKKKKGTKKEKIPDANDDKGITVTIPNKRKTPLKKGNKKQLEDISSADEGCAEMPVSAADVKNSASLPNVRDLEMQDSEMQRGFQKMLKPIIKKNKRRSKKLISSEESEKELAELSEDDGYLDNECSVPQAQESRMRCQKLIKPDCQNQNFIVSGATLLDASDESPYLIDDAPENTSESGSDCATSSITVGKTLVSPRKVAQLEEIKNTPQLLSSDSEGNNKPEPRSQRKSREDLYTSTVGSGPTVPRIVRLTTANEKPITYEPYTSSSGSDNEYEYGTQLHKIIPPSKTPNVRRSKRTRVKPLAYWKGERVNYKIRPSGGFLVEGVVPPAEVEPPRKAVAKRRIYNKQKGHIPTYVEPLTEDYVEPAKVLDADTGTITTIDCVRTSENCLYHDPDQPISICKSIRNSAFSTGKLKIGPFQEKGLQFVCMDTIVFYIMTGSVQLTLHLSTYNLKTGDFFYIPPGNMYNVKNLLNEDAVLIFTQIKGGS
ncbi:hypothetical protein XELAEV_18005899mg [Xenopus laevis]|uniref:Centromere protein C n=2 Tax=Xenopus laevis TaxID=8355 RepID=A0A974I3A3_XENLA|nr:hypothetical protein XELAEV_18005899mg [Xenopus laevis]